MIFKNLSVYRLGESINPEEFARHLNARPFEPCGARDKEKAGFAQVFGLNSRYYEQNKVFLFSYVTETRKADPGAVKTALDKRIKELTKERGEKIKAKEKSQIKEELTGRMTLEAPPKASTQWAYIDNINKLLVVDTGSPKNADILVSVIRGGLTDPVCYPLRPQHDVAESVSHWIRSDELPQGLTTGSSCMISNGGPEIRYSKTELDDDGLKEYVVGGYTVDQIDLCLDGDIEFTLTNDFMLKRFRLTDAAMENHDAGSGEPLEVISADIIIMSTSVNKLVEKLLNELGGEAIP